ncbi:glycoside hydrolase family 2 [Sciscionella marina]|uniref:glycoside hydrolase family 2 protein n=1 Tax=Sciscionella marina TaxID=508770 RepID=UPI000367A55A
MGRSLGRSGVLVCCVVAALLAGMVGSASAGQWHRKTPPISTPWTDAVGPGNALPEYPRPQLQRERWLNLNGLWQYGTNKNALDEQILVPYSPESALSGIQRHDDRMWYQRSFTVPNSWHGQRILLHFGAVSQEATVFVNGKQVASHRGGYGSFSADVTDAIRGTGPQRLTVSARADVENGAYPIGKQRIKPGGILYTASSGIWQTVWAEPVPSTHLAKLDVTPDPENGAFRITPRATGHAAVEVTVREKSGRLVAKGIGSAGKTQRLRIAHPRLWSPEDPYLYDIRARVLGSGDSVRSYAGMREIGIKKDSQGRPRMALNGKIVFQHGPLDQGYWPDGIYTAPTDSALRYDLEQTKALGFNMVRKHTKVEPARWYYWADKLGLLVWQDMPALPIDLDIPPEQSPPPTTAQRANLQDGLRELIDQHRSDTSIVTWVPFNEGWGEFDTERIAEETKRLDPTRLVDAESGVNCCYSEPDTGAGDIYDDHTYVGPGKPTVRDARAIADGEYGGLGLVLDGHVWPGKPQAYEMEKTQQQLTRRYGEVSKDLAKTVRDNGLSAAVYTQTTDVENEVNGLMTYDRRIVKADPRTVRADNLAVIKAGTE